MNADDSFGGVDLTICVRLVKPMDIVNLMIWGIPFTFISDMVLVAGMLTSREICINMYKFYSLFLRTCRVGSGPGHSIVGL